MKLKNDMNDLEKKSDDVDGNLSKQLDKLKTQIASKAESKVLNDLEKELKSADSGADSKIQQLGEDFLDLKNGLPATIESEMAEFMQDSEDETAALKAQISALQTEFDKLVGHLSSAKSVAVNPDGSTNTFSPNQNLMIGALVVFNVATIIGCTACLFAKMNSKNKVAVYDDVQQDEVNLIEHQ